MPHTFSSNYSFIANFLDKEIKKRKKHISLRVGKFPRFEIFNFPTRREIPYASVQTDCIYARGRCATKNAAKRTRQHAMKKFWTLSQIFSIFYFDASPKLTNKN